MFGYINGKVLPENEIHIAPRDLGVLRGYAVFDVMPVFHGEPFRAEDHWKRLEKSARILRLSLPVGFEEWERTVRDLVRKNGLKDASVRTVCSGGESVNGMDPKKGKETFFILTDTFQILPQEWYENGVKVITKRHTRMFPEAKLTDYIFPVMHLEEKKNAGAVEIIYLSGERVFEASTSNFCVVKNGAVASPNSEVLEGITRKVVAELARDLDIPFESREVTVEELFGADEIFLTASNKHILPVTQVDDRAVADGKVGPVTKKLMEAFLREVTAF